MFVGASLLWGGTYSLLAAFLFWKGGPANLVILGVMLGVGVGFVAAGLRLWDRSLVALAAIFVLLGLGSLQTLPGNDDPTHGAAGRAFHVAGIVLIVAGAATYLVARRRGAR
jgi:hypothetical protein